MKIKRIPPKDHTIESIRYLIIKERLSPHDPLPAERDLSKLLDVSRTTVRTALLFLEDENEIYRIPSVGSFVGSKKIPVNLTSMDSTSEYIKKNNLSLNNFVISWRIYEGNSDINKYFKKEKLLLFELIRIRYVNEEPFSYDISTVNYRLCPNIEKFDFSEKSLFEILQNEYNISLSHGEEKISISYSTDLESLYLQIPKASPVFYVKGTIYNENNEVIEYVKQVIRHDKILYKTKKLLRKP